MREMMKGRVVPIGGRRAVHLFLEEDGSGCIEFESPIENGELKNGKPIPRAVAIRRKNQIITTISLSKDALYALQKLLNNMLDEVA